MITKNFLQKFKKWGLKRSLFLTGLIIFGFLLFIGFLMAINHASFRLSEDQGITAFETASTTRLRFLISNEGDIVTTINYQLEWAKTSDCSSGSYSAVPTDYSEDWHLATSTYITDGEATFNIEDQDSQDALTDPVGTFISGELKDESNTTGNITLSYNEFTEIEYALQAVDAYAEDGAQYCFRLTNNGSSNNFTYSIYATTTMKEFFPIFIQTHYRWRWDDGIEKTFACGDSFSFTYRGSSVTYGSVSSQGECWMDRNLGASQAATAYNDSAAYGDLFQWGRLDDDHQSRSSGTQTGLSSSDDPGHSNFIYGMDSPRDWRDPQNANMWKEDGSGVNNPCPSGWRIPTNTEWNTERVSWGSNDRDGAFASPLKLAASGSRNYINASVSGGSSGRNWSSSAPALTAEYLLFWSTDAGVWGDYRAFGHSVRCLMD